MKKGKPKKKKKKKLTVRDWVLAVCPNYDSLPMELQIFIGESILEMNEKLKRGEIWWKE